MFGLILDATNAIILLVASSYILVDVYFNCGRMFTRELSTRNLVHCELAGREHRGAFALLCLVLFGALFLLGKVSRDAILFCMKRIG